MQYTVAFANARGRHIAVRTAGNIAEMRLCDSSIYDSIKKVQLTVNWRSLSKTLIANVTEDPLIPGTCIYLLYL